jgi:hypothetical protein
MTQAAFQSVLARLVINPAYRSRVRAEGEAGLGAEAAELSELEQRRALAVAADRGLDITRTLYHAWRLTKVLTLLPLTSALLGDELAATLEGFWRTRPARSLYFVEECLSFCEYLRRSNRVALPYVLDVVTFEEAKLRLRQDVVHGRAPVSRSITLRHEPQALLGALARGETPASPAPGTYVLEGVLDSDGQDRWHIVGSWATATPSPHPRHGNRPT